MRWQSRFFGLGALQQVTILFIAALAIETALVLLLPQRFQPILNNDYTRDYKPTAENILSGRGIVRADGQLELRYPPGYPLLLVFAFRTADALKLSANGTVVAFNLVTGAASSAFIYLIAVFLFGEQVGLLTWLLWVTYLPNLATLFHPNSEVPFMLFLYGAVWILFWGSCRSSSGVAIGILAGAVLGTAALIRPIALFLPLLLAPSVLGFTSIPIRKRVAISTLLIVGFGLSIAPWEFYVMAKTSKLVPLCLNGPTSMSDGLEFALDPGSDGERVRASDHLLTLMQRARAERPNMETVGDVLNFLHGEAVSNPQGFSELIVLKLLRSWYGMASKKHETAILLLQSAYFAFILAGFVLSVKKFRSKLPWVIFLALLVAYFWGMTILVVPHLRYMVPSMAFLMPFASVGIIYLLALLGADKGTLHEAFQPKPNRPTEMPSENNASGSGPG